MIGIKDQCYGVEVEMTGITRRQAAKALADYFGTEPRYSGGIYDTWLVTDGEGKDWKLMSDSSIRAEQKSAYGYEPTTDMGYRVEMVTPKLTYEELPKFQECVRRVRKAGAKVNSSCGLHVHVDAANHNRQSLKNLIGIMYSKEDILFKALQVDENRASRWCQKVREPMLQEARRLSSEETKDFTKLENIWYEGDNGSNEHYNWTRYYALNLHSVFYRGTVEWRCFNSTLHAGRAAAYVNLCLAISAHPHLYDKQPVTVRNRDGQQMSVMAYVMTGSNLWREAAMPSEYYYRGIQDGYQQNGLPVSKLKAALAHTSMEIFQKAKGRSETDFARSKPPKRRNGHER
jgi:hypothetical protein